MKMLSINIGNQMFLFLIYHWVLLTSALRVMFKKAFNASTLWEVVKI